MGSDQWELVLALNQPSPPNTSKPTQSPKMG
jgi:hypothetical protein